MLDVLVLPRFHLPRAGRALAALLRDPDDLPQVFTLIDSISGTAPHRLLLAFRRSGSRGFTDEGYGGRVRAGASSGDGEAAAGAGYR